jgi:hypothetical protein
MYTLNARIFRILHTERIFMLNLVFTENSALSLISIYSMIFVVEK